MWTKELSETLELSPVIAVVVVESAESAVQTASALLRGGVRHIEIALRTDQSLMAIEALVNIDSEMLIGAGTVLTVEHMHAVADLGVSFAVAPGLNPSVVNAARERDVPFAPGIATPSEIEAANGYGCRTLKLFPAQALGGVDYLKSVSAAYRRLGCRYIPFGGVTRDNMVEWFQLPEVLAVGGSWLAPHHLIAGGNWKEIEERARDASQAARTAVQERRDVR